jgi:hypothetical protein
MKNDNREIHWTGSQRQTKIFIHMEENKMKDLLFFTLLNILGWLDEHNAIKGFILGISVAFASILVIIVYIVLLAHLGWL